MRKRWVYIDGQAIDADEFVPEPTADYHVMPDIRPYQSMCDGSMINSRSQHRDHLKAHGVVEVGNEMKHLYPRPANLKGTGVKQALVDSLQRAKEQHGSRHIERAISETMNRAYEINKNRR